jgi:hypothetical protein
MSQHKGQFYQCNKLPDQYTSRPLDLLCQIAIPSYCVLRSTYYTSLRLAYLRQTCAHFNTRCATQKDVRETAHDLRVAVWKLGTRQSCCDADQRHTARDCAKGAPLIGDGKPMLRTLLLAVPQRDTGCGRPVWARCAILSSDDPGLNASLAPLAPHAACGQP